MKNKLAADLERLAALDTTALWVSYGCHRGYLGACSGGAAYYLGRDDIVGHCGAEFRMVFEATNFRTEPWFKDIGKQNPHQPWQGPVLTERHGRSVTSAQVAARKALVVRLNKGNTAKPKAMFRLKEKVIDKQDRPDAGRTLLWHPESSCYMIESDPDSVDRCLGQGCEDVTGLEHHEAAYAVTLRKPKFKLKPQQQGLFDNPYKRPFTIKGRG